MCSSEMKGLALCQIKWQKANSHENICFVVYQQWRSELCKLLWCQIFVCDIDLICILVLFFSFQHKWNLHLWIWTRINVSGVRIWIRPVLDKSDTIKDVWRAQRRFWLLVYCWNPWNLGACHHRFPETGINQNATASMAVKHLDFQSFRISLHQNTVTWLQTSPSLFNNKQNKHLNNMMSCKNVSRLSQSKLEWCHTKLEYCALHLKFLTYNP